MEKNENFAINVLQTWACNLLLQGKLFNFSEPPFVQLQREITMQSCLNNEEGWVWNAWLDYHMEWMLRVIEAQCNTLWGLIHSYICLFILVEQRVIETRWKVIVWILFLTFYWCLHAEASPGTSTDPSVHGLLNSPQHWNNLSMCKQGGYNSIRVSLHIGSPKK